MIAGKGRSRTSLVAAVVIGIAGIGALVAWMAGGSGDAADPVATRPDEVVGSTDTASESGYADGTYEARGSYVSPAGAEGVDVSLTLANGIVTDATFASNATNPASVRNQGQFAAGYRQLVVGKPLDELNLRTVNGSSLTPKGFMDAVAKIKVQAAAS